MHEVQPFVTDGEATKAMQPREGTLDDPARAPETRAVQRPAPGELRGDPAERELVPMRLRVVSPVPLNQVRLADRSPRPPAQRRNVVDQRQQSGPDRWRVTRSRGRVDLHDFWRARHLSNLPRPYTNLIREVVSQFIGTGGTAPSAAAEPGRVNTFETT